MHTKEIILEVIKYLDHRINNCRDEYEWRECCQLFKNLSEHFDVSNAEISRYIGKPLNEPMVAGNNTSYDLTWI